MDPKANANLPSIIRESVLHKCRKCNFYVFLPQITQNEKDDLKSRF